MIVSCFYMNISLLKWEFFTKGHQNDHRILYSPKVFQLSCTEMPHSPPPPLPPPPPPPPTPSLSSSESFSHQTRDLFHPVPSFTASLLPPAAKLTLYADNVKFCPRVIHGASSSSPCTHHLFSIVMLLPPPLGPNRSGTLPPPGLRSVLLCVQDRKEEKLTLETKSTYCTFLSHWELL